MRKSVAIRRVIGVLGIATLVVAGGLANADITPPPPPPPSTGCDFLTGGGFIFPTAGKGTFAIGGGCRHGSGINDVPYWGHLEYHDHGLDLNVHWNDITAYFPEGTTGADPQTGQPTGVRWVCGTARTDKFGDVDFAVRASDAGEPGTADEFDIQLTQNGVIVYSTFLLGTHHQLGGGTGGGGNIQLHKPNDSTTGVFGGSCPAAP